jgi:hypothetical protein
MEGMDIKSFIKSYGTYAQAAETLGFKGRTLASWCRHERTPSREQAHALIIKSEGRLTYEDIFGPNPQAQSITGQDHRVAERRSTNRRVTTRRKLSPGTNT